MIQKLKFYTFYTGKVHQKLRNEKKKVKKKKSMYIDKLRKEGI